MKKRDWMIGMGVLIGMSLGKFIYPLIGNISEKMTSNNANTQQVQQYIQNSQEIEMNFSKYQESQTEYDNHFTQYFTSHNFIFYDSIRKKEFAVKSIGGANDMYDFLELIFKYSNSCKIIGVVNLIQLNDSVYGSKQNPIPVFKCSIPQYYWNKDMKEDMWRLDRYNTKYHKNIYRYLKYFMPKEEFKKMFGVKK